MMSIGQSIFFVSCLAGMMLALPALLAFLSMIFPHTIERAAQRLERGWILPFFAGIIPLGMVGVVGSLLLSLGSVAQFCGSLVWLALLTWGFSGLAVMGRLIGAHIGEATRSNALIETLIGGVILAFAIAFPIIGWFVIFPVGVVLGTGALNIALVLNIWGRLSGFAAAPIKPKYEYDLPAEQPS